MVSTQEYKVRRQDGVKLITTNTRTIKKKNRKEGRRTSGEKQSFDVNVMDKDKDKDDILVEQE
eukprot:8289242-Ditylum_brightwellii.AAC.1